MNKARKIIISIYVAVCFLIFIAILFWNARFNQLFLESFIWCQYDGNCSKFDSSLIEILFSGILSWIILAIPTFFIYKHWDDKKQIQGITSENKEPRVECEVTFMPTYKSKKIENKEETRT